MDSNDNSFLGVGWAFPPSFDKDSRKLKMVAGEEDIKESIRIILGTIPTERVMYPKFGCDLISYVFESNDPTLYTMLKDTISDALLYFEPRIKVKEIKFDKSQFMEGILKIFIDYTIIITNTRSNMVYPFYFNEGTNI
ncbi:GPW/gp25 family protein [Algoriphagus halophilus]|uniref:GPW/gp25 family protein n=1 Tax=Algoriphagus halophilus TaxID=226505 RepID=UPI00358E4F17